MEIDSSTAPPKPPRHPAEDDALASQLLETIGGTSLQTQKQEEPEVWLMEEGDDSVFYSDEEQPEDFEAKTFGDFGPEHRVTRNSLAGDESEEAQKDEGLANESIINKENLTLQLSLTEPDKQRHNLKETEPTDQLDAAKPGEESEQHPEKIERRFGGSLLPNCTTEDMQTQKEGTKPIEKENPLIIAKEESALITQTPNLKPSDVTNEERNTRPKRETRVPEQMPKDEVLMSGKKQQLQRDQKPEKDPKFSIPIGFHQNLSPGYASLPPLKRSSQQKSGQQNSFDHLSSSRYSTVSYRRIRRGNTRKKIEEFEYMMMNL